MLADDSVDDRITPQDLVSAGDAVDKSHQITPLT